jgi:protein SEY1
MATLSVNGGQRPSNVKHPSAPTLMMNSHFASVGEDASKEAYEHGIQVIDEDKVFK